MFIKEEDLRKDFSREEISELMDTTNAKDFDDLVRKVNEMLAESQKKEFGEVL